MGKCAICGTPISHGGYCNKCLKKHRRIHNYLLQLSWVLDQKKGICDFCDKSIEYICDYEIHHKGEKSWSQPDGTQNSSTDRKLKEIKRWMLAGKLPDDVLVLHTTCHRRVHVMDKLEVIRYRPNMVDNFELKYDPYKKAFSELEINSLLRDLETKRVSFMTELGRKRYEKNQEDLENICHHEP